MPDRSGPSPRRPSARPSAGRPSVARRALTTRAAVLGMVLCALVLSAAVPMREFLAQRGEIGRLETAQAQQRSRVAALEARQRQLADPAYVRQQARERFGYVLPGETNYQVLRPGQEQAAQPRGGQAVPSAPARPWYAELWESVQEADRPEPEPVPAPSPR